jgi:hypothetical protein
MRRRRRLHDRRAGARRARGHRSADARSPHLARFARFRARPGTPAAPPLDEPLRAETETILAKASGWTHERAQFARDRVRLELDDDAFAYGPSAALDLFDPSYVELSAVLEPRFIRLADPPARDYLGTRVEVSALDIAITVIDDTDRFYFVVARRLSFTHSKLDAPGR